MKTEISHMYAFCSIRYRLVSLDHRHAIEIESHFRNVYALKLILD